MSGLFTRGGEQYHTQISTDISRHFTEVDLAFLGQKIETFVNKQAAKMVAQAKQLLPAALETAMREKERSLQERHVAAIKQVNDHTEGGN